MLHSRGSIYDKTRSRNNVIINLYRAEFSQIIIKLRLMRVLMQLKCILNLNWLNKKEAQVY
jgi:hypothetical protein